MDTSPGGCSSEKVDPTGPNSARNSSNVSGAATFAQRSLPSPVFQPMTRPQTQPVAMPTPRMRGPVPPVPHASPTYGGGMFRISSPHQQNPLQQLPVSPAAGTHLRQLPVSPPHFEETPPARPSSTGAYVAQLADSISDMNLNGEGPPPGKIRRRNALKEGDIFPLAHIMQRQILLI